jgi:glutathionylspermidine synthase
MLDGLSCGERLPKELFEEIKRRSVREAFKWNVTDSGADKLCDFPLVVERSVWRSLSELAVRLSAEAELAEAELATRPLLGAALGIPWRLQLALLRSPAAPSLRYCRFDFHPTVDGHMAITEGNLDVAAGWNEASGVTALVAEHVQEGVTAGDPAARLAMRLAERIGVGSTVGIMHLTRYTDDHQVARFLAATFERHGLDVVLFDPTQLRSAGRQAGALVGDRVRPLDAVFRFFPAEWSCRLDNPREWFEATRRPGTIWLNPLSTVFTQSKRFPLTWRFLRTKLPTWSRLLPETRSPLFVRRSNWVLKPAFGHEGYQVAIAGTTSPARVRTLWRSARQRPWRWAAQRKFSAKSIATPHGPRFPCVGVHVVDGEACGLYGRLSERPLIDDASQDVVVLVRR